MTKSVLHTCMYIYIYIYMGSVHRNYIKGKENYLSREFRERQIRNNDRSEKISDLGSKRRQENSLER